MEWDIKSLREDCDLRALAPWLGLKTKQMGSTTFIECLSGTHAETNTDHCEAKRNGCRCYSCHVKYRTGVSNPDDDWNDVIDVVQAFKRRRGEDVSFSAACETIAEFLGNRDGYLLKEGTREKRTVLPYSEDELLAAGLTVDYRTRQVMTNLYEKDERFFRSILLSKLEETMGKLKSILAVSSDIEITDEARKRLQSASRFYERLTGKRKVEKRFGN